MIFLFGSTTSKCLRNLDVHQHNTFSNFTCHFNLASIWLSLTMHNHSYDDASGENPIKPLYPKQMLFG